MADNSELVNALSGGGLLNSIANPRVISPNLLADSYGKGTEIANALWRNKLAQSQQAVGEAQQGGIVDGVYDPKRAAQLIQQTGPTGALAAGAGLESNLRLASGGQEISGVDMARGQALVGSLLSANGGRGATYQQTSDALDTGVAAGFIRPEAKVAMLTGMPHGDDDRSVETRRHMMEMINERGQSAQQRLVNARPGMGTVENGQGVGGIQTAPLLGSGQPGALTPVGPLIPTGFPSRTQALEQVGQPADAKTAAALGVPIGTIITTPMLLRWQQQGAGSNLTGGLGGNPPLTPEQLMSPDEIRAGGIGARAPAGGGSVTSPPPAPQAAPAPAGGLRAVVTSPPPGTGEQAVESNKRFNDISDQSVAARSRGAVLDNMLADTSQFTSGPGTDVIARVRALANRLNINVNTEGLSAVESFKKLTAALNADQGSDARLAVKEASNPHGDMSPGGLDLMLRQLRGNEDYAQARGKLAAAHPDKTNIAGFEDKTGSQLDPRTFQYDRMTGPQKETYFKSLPDKAKFVKAHEAAAALLPGGQ
jgi:hypothetical protein